MLKPWVPSYSPLLAVQINLSVAATCRAVTPKVVGIQG